jgi:hypothetical protein
VPDAFGSAKNALTLAASPRPEPNVHTADPGKAQPVRGVNDRDMTLVLIDHHAARFFETAGAAGGSLEEGEALKPHDPHGFLRHLEHRKEADYKGQRVPEADEFYERVAQRLTSASSVLLVGDGTGKSSAMEYLLEYLKDKHKAIADRVTGTEKANVSGATLGQIEEIARRH